MKTNRVFLLATDMSSKAPGCDLEFLPISLDAHKGQEVEFLSLCVHVCACMCLNEREKTSTLQVFPFAQLVPFVCWIASYNWEWTKTALGFFGLSHSPDYNSNIKDPFRAYLMKKLKVHGGFLIESFVESIPQSILQMIGLVVNRDTGLLEVVSLAISLVSVGSRGLLLSYSLSRVVFVFNFVAFIADLFGFFCIISWLFLPDTGSSFFIVDFLPPVPNLVGVVYIVGFVIVGIILAISLLVALGVSVKDELEESWVKAIGYAILLFVFGSIVFLPVLVLCQGFIFAFFPVMLFDAIDGRHARAAPSYWKLHDFLNGALNRKDQRVRAYTVGLHFAKVYANTQSMTEANGWTRSATYRDPKYIKAVKLLTSKGVPQPRKKTWMRRITAPCRGYVNAAINENSSRSDKLLSAWMFIVVMPMKFLTAVLGIVFPFICIATVPLESVNELQLILTFIYFGCLFIMLLLAWPVGAFQRLLWMMETFYSDPSDEDVDKILAHYEGERLAKVRFNLSRLTVLAATVEATKDTAWSRAVIQLLPAITALAGLREGEGGYTADALMDAPWFGTLLTQPRELTLAIKEEAAPLVTASPTFASSTSTSSTSITSTSSVSITSTSSTPLTAAPSASSVPSASAVASASVALPAATSSGVIVSSSVASDEGGAPASSSACMSSMSSSSLSDSLSAAASIATPTETTRPLVNEPSQ